MKNKRKGKKRLVNTIARRSKEIKKLDKIKHDNNLKIWWRNIFVKEGILKKEEV